MSLQYSLLVEVIRVCFCASWMVCWEAERVEVLMCTNYGKEVVVILVTWKAGFDELTGDA